MKPFSSLTSHRVVVHVSGEADVARNVVHTADHRVHRNTEEERRKGIAHIHAWEDGDLFDDTTLEFDVANSVR